MSLPLPRQFTGSLSRPREGESTPVFSTRALSPIGRTVPAPPIAPRRVTTESGSVVELSQRIERVSADGGTVEVIETELTVETFDVIEVEG